MKKKNINFTLSFNQFVHLFPRDSSLAGNNFRRQHVFEQLCRVLLFLDMIMVFMGEKTIFKKVRRLFKCYCK